MSEKEKIKNDWSVCLEQLEGQEGYRKGCLHTGEGPGLRVRHTKLEVPTCHPRGDVEWPWLCEPGGRRAGAGRALKLGWGSPQGGLGSTHALPESGLSRLQELLKDPLLPQFSQNLGWIGTLVLLPSPGRPHLKAACP